MSTVYIRLSIHPPVPRQREHQRAPVLELLLAQASQPQPCANWRSDAYAAIGEHAAPLPAIAAVALVAARGASGAAFTCLATPLQLSAGMTSVTLPADGVLILDLPTAQALAGDFNRHFGDSGATLSVGLGAVLLCEFDRSLQVSTHDPAQLAGRDLFESQPTGADAGRLRRLMSEMEMWLFDHRVNRARVARQLPQISSLWLWGGGVPLSELPVIHGWTAGHDPFFSAFGLSPEFPSDGRSGVLVLAEHPDETAWTQIEQSWLQPAYAAFRAKRIASIELSLGAVRLHVGRRRWWKLRRRVRPWWEYFDS